MGESTIFVKPEGKITVKPVKRGNGMVKDPNHEAYFLFGPSTIDMQLPRTLNKSLVNPFHSKDEQLWLEKELDIDLNPHKRKENFWEGYKVKMGKDERTLNLANPKDYLDYLVLRANSKLVAPSGEDQKKKATYKYALVKENFEIKEKASKVDKKMKAYKLFGKMEDDKEKMLNFLKVYGKRVDNNSKNDFLKTQIENTIIEDIDKFLELAEDQNFDMKLLIEEGVACGAIQKYGREYHLQGGDKLCYTGELSTINNVVKYLADTANQDILLMIKTRVKNAKD